MFHINENIPGGELNFYIFLQKGRGSLLSFLIEIGSGYVSIMETS